jgi:alpha-L-fucosidase
VPLRFKTRRLVEKVEGSGRYDTVFEDAFWNAHETAVIICDMWNAHTCKFITRNVVEMAPHINQVAKALRQRGVLVIHSPSSMMDFYRGAPQRKRVLETPAATYEIPLAGLMWAPEYMVAPYPIDDSDNGCPCSPKCPGGNPWFRQQEAIEIDEKDAIDDSPKIYDLMRQRQIKNVVFMGVATNMCVLGRAFGIRQLRTQGYNVLLIRDLTDSAYNPKMRPGVDHYTGTDLVVWHIERYWCPTITSDQIIGGQPFRFTDDKRTELPKYEDYEQLFPAPKWTGRTVPGLVILEGQDSQTAWYRCYTKIGNLWGRDDYRRSARVFIDDVHGRFQAYFNGTKIAESTDAAYGPNWFVIPGELLRPNRYNMLAIRVEAESGKVGFVGRAPVLASVHHAFDLAGKWQFMLGDDPGWAKLPEDRPPSIVGRFTRSTYSENIHLDLRPQREGVSRELARPGPARLAWQDYELGLSICWAPNTYQDVESDNLSTPLEQINPTALNTDEWADVAVGMGTKYIRFIAKHEGGFPLWQTDTTDYGIKNTPWRGGKGDILADIAKSCRARDLKLVVYCNATSRHDNAGGGGQTRDPAYQETYNKIFRRQLTEVMTQYGPIECLWFDGSCVIPIEDLVEKYLPDGMVFQSPCATLRWGGNESGVAPYPIWNAVMAADARTGVATARHGTPYGDVWMPLVFNSPIRGHTWFWKSWQKDSDKDLKSLDHLMECYYKTVGRGCHYLLNLAPDTTGRFNPIDVKRALEFGAEIRRRFGQSIAETKGRGTVVELDLVKTVLVDHIILQEDIAQGQRVLAYVVEGLEDGQWYELCRGISIGHKKIDWFKAVEVSRLRLRCVDWLQEPLIRRFAAFYIGLDKPFSRADVSEPVKVVTVGSWGPAEVGSDWQTFEVDLSEHIRDAGQYQLEFCPGPQSSKMEIQSVAFIRDGLELPDRVERLDATGSFNLNVQAIPTAETSIVLRVTARSLGESPCAGDIVLRQAAGM